MSAGQQVTDNTINTKKKKDKTHTISLPNGETLSVPLTMWGRAQRIEPQLLPGEGLEQAELFRYFYYIFSLSRSDEERNGAYEFLKEYLDKGGDPNFSHQGVSLFMLALELSTFKVICLLLDNDQVNVNWRGDNSGWSLGWYQSMKPQSVLHSLIDRNHPGKFQQLLDIYVDKVRRNGADIFDRAQKHEIELLHPEEEIKQLWRRLLAKGASYTALDQHGNNVLQWAVKNYSRHLLPCLTAQYAQDNTLAEAILQQGSFGVALFEIVKNEEHEELLSGWLQSIDISHEAAFQAAISPDKIACLIAMLLMGNSRDHLTQFISVCERCHVPIDATIWSNVLQVLVKGEVSVPKKLTQKDLMDKIKYCMEKAGQNVSILSLLQEILIPHHTSDYKLAKLIIKAASALELSIDTQDEGTQWNPLCYLIRSLQGTRLYGKEVDNARALWTELVRCSSQDARLHAQRMMNVGDIWALPAKDLIGHEGLVLPAAAAAAVVAEAPALEVRLDAQSTHRSVVHQSTSQSEQVLAKRYLANLAIAEHKKQLWDSIDTYFYSDWLPASNQTSYLDNLRRSVESREPIPGDDGGQIKQSLISRWNWIQTLLRDEPHVRRLQNLWSLFQQRTPVILQQLSVQSTGVAVQGAVSSALQQSGAQDARIATQQLLVSTQQLLASSQDTQNFLQKELNIYTWYRRTYTLFKQFILNTSYQDPVSKVSLEQAFLMIWQAIHDERYALTAEARLSLKNQLRIAMIEIVHQYGGARPSCPSGAHNLLIESVGKGEGVPGIYSFSDSAERLQSIQALKTRFSVEAHFLSLSESDKAAWFQSPDAYDKALAECQTAFDMFFRYGENGTFKLFSEEELQHFVMTHLIDWQVWIQMNADRRPSDSQIIISALRGLSEETRLQSLMNYHAFYDFVQANLPSISQDLIQPSLFEDIRKEFQDDKLQIELFDYAKVQLESVNLQRWINEHWNTYYCTLKQIELNHLLSQLNHQPTGDLIQDRNTFARLDRDRLLGSRIFTLDEQAQIQEGYEVWLGELDSDQMQVEDTVDVAQIQEAVVTPDTVPPITFPREKQNAETAEDVTTGKRRADDEGDRSPRRPRLV